MTMKKKTDIENLDPSSVSCFVLTVSDTRTPKTDESGRTIVERLKGAGHVISGYNVVPDEAKEVVRTLRQAAEGLRVDAMIVSGGTGLTKRDATYEAIEKILERSIPGFGESFRSQLFLRLGPLALLSRAAAGVYRGKILFSIPGSPESVRLAMDKLILPVLGHAVGELRKDR
jgi:molybdenum cofactor biosynthesis protein B